MIQKLKNHVISKQSFHGLQQDVDIFHIYTNLIVSLENEILMI